MTGPGTAVVVNPTKWDDLTRLRSEVEAPLADAGWPAPAWFETSAHDTGAGQAEQAVRAGAEVLFVGGGDGTVRSCLDAVAGRCAALAILPAGTGNVLAANLGVPMDVAGAVRTAVAGRRRRIDIGRLDDQPFAIVAGIGFGADFLHDAPEQLKRRVGWPAYLVSAARHLTDPHAVVDIHLDGGIPMRCMRTVLVANVGELRGGLAVAPDAVADDAVLDVVVVTPRKLADWVGVLYRMLRRRPHEQVLRRTATEVDVRAVRGPVSRQLDGDLVPAAEWSHVRVDPGAVEVCVP